MATFCVAYKNKHTESIHQQQKNESCGWVRISPFTNFTDAKKRFDNAKKQFSEDTAIGIFSENGDTPWFCKSPRFIHNRHVIFSDKSVRDLFGGIINSLESDWF